MQTPWTVPSTINGGPTLVNLSYLASRFEDVRQAEHFLRLLQPYQGRFFQAITTHHVADHYSGMLAATAGHIERGAALLGAAVDVQDAAGAPLLAAESRLEWARLSLLDHSWTGAGARGPRRRSDRRRRPMWCDRTGRTGPHSQGRAVSTSTEPWTDSRLDALRAHGDAEIDELLAGLDDMARDMVIELYSKFVRAQLDLDPDLWPAELITWWNQPQHLPPWADEQKIARCSQVLRAVAPGAADDLPPRLVADCVRRVEGRARVEPHQPARSSRLADAPGARDLAVRAEGERARRSDGWWVRCGAGEEDAGLPRAGARDDHALRRRRPAAEGHGDEVGHRGRRRPCEPGGPPRHVVDVLDHTLGTDRAAREQPFRTPTRTRSCTCGASSGTSSASELARRHHCCR